MEKEGEGGGGPGGRGGEGVMSLLIMACKVMHWNKEWEWSWYTKQSERCIIQCLHIYSCIIQRQNCFGDKCCKSNLQLGKLVKQLL